MNPSRMKHALLISVFASASLLGATADAKVSDAAILHLSPDGDDRNNATAESPLKSLAAAFKIIASQPRQKHTLVLTSGSYALHETLQLTKAHSNTSIRATGPGVVVHGGKVISPKHIRKVEDAGILSQLIESGAKQKLWVADLKSAGISDYGQIGPRGFGRGSPTSDMRLSVGGQALYPAQWPNKGQLGFPIGKVVNAGGNPRGGGNLDEGGSFHYANDRISQWANSSDTWLHGFFHHGYADDLIGIESIDTASKTITMSHAAFYSIKSGRPWNRAHGIHILAEIDQPGEFYIDRDKGLCYFIPPAGTDPRTNPVLAPVMSKPLIALSDCRNITFKGITFEQTRGTGITVENGARNRFVGCVIRNTGGKGIEITGQDGPMKSRQGSMQHAIIDCDIYNTGTGGITLAGGSQHNLKPAGNLVSNCHIHHNNMVDKTYCPAVSLSGVGNIVRNCDIHDILGAAVLFSGNDNILEFNNIYNAMTFGDDMGVCYTGRSIISFGNKIRSNYIYNCGNTPNVSSVYTIYLDDGACGTQVYNNIFRRSAKAQVFLIGGGSYNRVYGNISIDNPVFLRVGNRLATWAKHLLAAGGMFRKQFDTVTAGAPPWSTAYPELARYWQEDPKTPRNLMRDNLLVRGHGELHGNRNWVQGNAAKHIRPENKLADWHHTKNANREISSYARHLPALKIPSLHKIGLQRSPWRNNNNIHRANP